MSDNGQQVVRKIFLDAFSKSMNEEHLKELEEIIDNKNLTKQQIQDQLQSLCERSGSKSVKKFDEIEKFIDGIKEHALKKIKKVEGKLSPEALGFVKQVQEIHEDKTITPSQEEQKLKELANNASPLLKKELKSHDIYAHLF